MMLGVPGPSSTTQGSSPAVGHRLRKEMVIGSLVKGEEKLRKSPAGITGLGEGLCPLTPWKPFTQQRQEIYLNFPGRAWSILSGYLLAFPQVPSSFIENL